MQVPAFEIDQYEVTNRQYLAFMTAGGYETRAFWSDDDWNWKTAHAISHPVFWTKARDGWLYRGMFEEIPLPLDWPVYVSHAEAMAYARWAGKSLPTEAAVASRGLRHAGRERKELSLGQPKPRSDASATLISAIGIPRR